MTLAVSRAELSSRLESLVERRRLAKRDRLAKHPMATVRNSVKVRAANAFSRLGKWWTLTVPTFLDRPMKIVVPSGYSDIWQYGAVVDADAEVRLTKHLLRALPEGATFFDVGACLGYYSMLAARLVGPEGSVHAFEPVPWIVPLLEENLGDFPRARVIEKAICDKTGPAKLHLAKLPWIGTSSIKPEGAGRQEADVLTTSLDEYCYSREVFPDFIKLDVEGVEEPALRGAERLLREKSPTVALEIFNSLREEDRRALQTIGDLGYAPFAIEPDGSLRELDYAGLPRYFGELQGRYAAVQDCPNDFDNLIFKKP
jgi:FkbM family methyltransferase